MIKVLLSVCVFLFISFGCSAHSSKWFVTPDQQAYSKMKKKQYADAEKQFEDLHWKAAAAYRSGKYQRAAELYANFATPKGWYNRGNSLALLGDLENAILAYESALRLRPGMVDAKHNLSLLRKIHITKRKKDRKNRSLKNKKNKKNQKKHKKNGKDKRGKAKRNIPHKAKKQHNNPSRTKLMQPISKNQKTGSDKSDLKGNSGKEAAFVQPKQLKSPSYLKRWLRKVPDNPGGLLKRKFARDYDRYIKQGEKSHAK